MSRTLCGEPGPGARTARRAQTWERLIGAAVGVFAERGVIGASVEEICERAGYTRGAFYSNFTDKDALVLAMLRHFAERDLQRVADVSHDLTEPPAMETTDLQTLISIALSRLFGDSRSDRDEVLARQEIDLYAVRRPAVRRPYQEYVDQLEHRVADVIDTPLRAVGIEFVIDRQVAVRLLHAGYNQAQLTALIRDEPPDPRPMAELIGRLTRPVGTHGTP